MENNNKRVIALLIVIIVILSVLCFLLTTGTICFNTSEINSDDTNGFFEEIVGTYKKTIHNDVCGDMIETLTINSNGTADIHIDNDCSGDSSAINAIFSINEKQIFIIDKNCEMSGENCSIGGGCYSGGCQPLWTFDYTIDGKELTIVDFTKQ